MDRSLDEIISEHPRDRPLQRGRPRPDPRTEPRYEPRRAPPPPRQPRREEYPRDGVRKNRRDDRVNLDSDWVHDRYEEDRFERRGYGSASATFDDPRRAPPPPRNEGGVRLRVDNIHYDLGEGDLRELFERIGPVESVRMLYDRMDRSSGTAFVTYRDVRDAEDAIKDYDGANANGQPIKVTLLPNAPAAAAPRGNMFDRVERPAGRSLFDRIEGQAGSRDDSREDPRSRRRRSESPRRRAPPETFDRYMPRGGRSRSPIRRRGTPRESGRRPGQRREDSGRGGGRRPRVDDEGRPVVGGRPRKTADELDAEMDDYFRSKGDDGQQTNGANSKPNGSAAAPASGNLDDDIDMIE